MGQHYLPSQSDSFSQFSSNRCAIYRRTTVVYYDYDRLQFCPQFSEIYSVKCSSPKILSDHIAFGLEWSGGAMVLGKLPVPGRPIYLE